MSVLVTGARGGIGAAIADAFLARGETVLAHDVRTPLPSDERDGVRHLAGDLLDPAHLRALASELGAAPLRAVVAAHGIAPGVALRELEPTQTERVMDVDFASVLALYALVEQLLADAGGSFTAIASQAGLRGEVGMGAYCAAKFALVGWVRALGAVPDAPVRMRAICPGVVDTPLLSGAFADVARAERIDPQAVRARRLATVPLDRLAAPAEIAAAVVWVADLPAAGAFVHAVAGGETFA